MSLGKSISITMHVKWTLFSDTTGVDWINMSSSYGRLDYIQVIFFLSKSKWKGTLFKRVSSRRLQNSPWYLTPSNFLFLRGNYFEPLTVSFGVDLSISNKLGFWSHEKWRFSSLSSLFPPWLYAPFTFCLPIHSTLVVTDLVKSLFSVYLMTM